MIPANKKFLDSIIPGAQEGHKLYGVPASVSLAQAILESGWGKKTPGNNLFGIKADSIWHGDKVLVDTHEIIHGRRIPVKAYFRAYSTLNESIKDHAEFLASNKRFHPAFECSTGCEFSKAIAKAGYATDPAYADLLVSIINSNDLEQFD